jgi:hypothetical protein
MDINQAVGFLQDAGSLESQNACTGLQKNTVHRHSKHVTAVVMTATPTTLAVYCPMDDLV